MFPLVCQGKKFHSVLGKGFRSVQLSIRVLQHPSRNKIFYQFSIIILENFMVPSSYSNAKHITTSIIPFPRQDLTTSTHTPKFITFHCPRFPKMYHSYACILFSSVLSFHIREMQVLVWKQETRFSISNVKHISVLGKYFNTDTLDLLRCVKFYRNKHVCKCL